MHTERQETAMDECNPTPARISEEAGSVTFLLRTESGEVIEPDPVLQKIFRGELARLWQAAFNKTPRPRSGPSPSTG